MFTVKLYGEGRTRICEAASVTAFHYSRFASQITVHQSKESGDDGPFYVGSHEPGAPEDQIWFERAIIENGSGKTTEMIWPDPRPGMEPATAQAA